MSTNDDLTLPTDGLEIKPAYRQRVGFLADSPNFPGDWNQIVEKVKIADELGFHSIWLGESWGYELFTSLTDLVRSTARIRVGAGVANIFSRSPAVLASSAATLDERSGGRFILGLGPSGSQVVEDWHGVPFAKPVQRMREYLQIVRMILRGEKLHYQGEIFQLERGFKLRFAPPRPDLPLYVAAMGPRNIQLSGELADGILPVYWPEDKWLSLRTQLDEASLTTGRSVLSVSIAPYITTIVLREDASQEEREMAYRKAATPLAYYIGRMGVSYAQMLTRNGYGEDVQAVLAGWQRGMKSAIAAVSPRLLQATALVGSAGEIVARLDQWALAGVDEPLLSLPDGSLEETALQLSALKAALEI